MSAPQINNLEGERPTAACQAAKAGHFEIRPRRSLHGYQQELIRRGYLGYVRQLQSVQAQAAQPRRSGRLTDSTMSAYAK